MLKEVRTKIWKLLRKRSFIGSRKPRNKKANLLICANVSFTSGIIYDFFVEEKSTIAEPQSGRKKRSKKRVYNIGLSDAYLNSVAAPKKKLHSAVKAEKKEG